MATKKKTKGASRKTVSKKGAAKSKLAKKPAKTKAVTPKAKAKSAPKKSVRRKAVTKPRPKPVKKTKATSKARRAVKPVKPVKKGAKATAKPKAKAKLNPKTLVAKKTAKKTAKRRPPRRDATGHLDPQYARELRARSRESQENRDDVQDRAFVSESHNREELSERRGEEAVRAMTSGDDEAEPGPDAEDGGPFVETTGREEYADDVDESNPTDATREPFPRV